MTSAAGPDPIEQPMSDPGQQRGTIDLRLFGRTDVGQVREHNEDNFLVANLTTGSRGLMEGDRQQTVGGGGTIFAVCDGMGGAAAGEVASQMAVDILYERMSKASPAASRDELAQQLVAAVEDAGIRIYNDARADATRRGMGTTATVGALIDSRLFLAQVGDSRAYVMRGGDVVQVTRDQSLVNQLIEAGQLTEEEAETFEHNNIILQALGTADAVQVDLTYVDLRRGDTLLMCSDGLSGMIRKSEIREVLQNCPEPLEACKQLTERANVAGGHDNITVIVVKFDGDGIPAVTADDEPLAYRKYPLPELSDTAPARPSHVARPVQGATTTPDGGSESARLRVGHTMLGASFAPEEPLPTPEPPRVGSDEPVELPTTGLTPGLLLVIVSAALLLVAAMGVLLLR